MLQALHQVEEDQLRDESIRERRAALMGARVQAVVVAVFAKAVAATGRKLLAVRSEHGDQQQVVLLLHRADGADVLPRVENVVEAVAIEAAPRIVQPFSRPRVGVALAPLAVALANVQRRQRCRIQAAERRLPVGIKVAVEAAAVIARRLGPRPEHAARTVSRPAGEYFVVRCNAPDGSDEARQGRAPIEDGGRGRC
eukprot:5238619-Prymnesium_polylepis.1